MWRKGAGKRKAAPKKAISKSCREDNDDASFEVVGYASYSEHMHTSDSTDDKGSSKHAFPVFNELVVFEVHLELGVEFLILKMFKIVMKHCNIPLGTQFKWGKNDKLRARAICRVKDYSWIIYCAWNGLSKLYQVKIFVEELQCLPKYGSH